MECSHCGRPVRPTIHRRDGRPPYQVDYYRLLTGSLQHRIIKSQKDEAETFSFYSLHDPRFVITCSDCMAKKEIRTELETMFSGVPEAVEDEEAPG